ncbi:hypothetical protein [uncultured Clostridium sp.]|mgnify:CR=1 FL=1|uniref:hypothetical protein n=1 Tax=uncultured Clostridium sp. TaxID=59620 RepID=UPI0025FB0BF4|nr:hypothetical protein [uncultured Clostridium sp.]
MKMMDRNKLEIHHINLNYIHLKTDIGCDDKVSSIDSSAGCIFFMKITPVPDAIKNMDRRKTAAMRLKE